MGARLWFFWLGAWLFCLQQHQHVFFVFIVVLGVITCLSSSPELAPLFD